MQIEQVLQPEAAELVLWGEGCKQGANEREGVADEGS